VKARWANLREDWPWSRVHDYTGNITDAPVTPSGLSVDRVLLPADPHAAFEVRRKNLNHTERRAAIFAITGVGGVPQSNFSRRKITLRYAAAQ
jgi:hypothetical protein